MYSVPVILTLLGMITMGAARIVAIKIYYQIEVEESRPVTPLFVTLLYLTGQALSLVVHFVCTRVKCCSSIDCCGGKAKLLASSQGYDTIDTAVRKLDGDDDDDNDENNDDDENDDDENDYDENDYDDENDDYDENDYDDYDYENAHNKDSMSGGELGNPTTITIIAGKPVLSSPTTGTPKPNKESSSSIASSSSPNDGLLPINNNKNNNKKKKNLDLDLDLDLITTVADYSTAAATKPQQQTTTTTTTTTTIHPRPRRLLRRRGSKTGLTEESEAAVAWVHAIPWYLRPVIPGVFNLCNSALRWACLVYVAASTAEILISGLELVLSSIAARVLRKRAISEQRWTGVAIITVGILLVGCAKLLEAQRNSQNQNNNNNNHATTDETHDFLVGNVLIFGQCVFSVLQDLSEEVFLQEADFPATLLLGMEGLFGLVFGLPIVAIWFADELDSDAARNHAGYELGLVVLVLVTGILNIRTTELTSSMTRNVWKQFRIMLVWILALLVYYLGGTINTNTDYDNDIDIDNDIDNDSGARFGEPWVRPDSWFVLGGFAVVLSGLSFYYSG
mmetsp:Transcript_22228/g.61892  ORF Transcript_22228/g.61892 Transcript_22228/m.61892 type:complete len:564 (-) Transcript_22228:1131-2822(-)